jgi:galactose mutarotase-like enzyme
MAVRTWILTDLDQDIYQDCLTVKPDHVEGPASGYSVVKRTLRGGIRNGVDVIEVDNGTCRFTVVPTRGMGVWRAAVGGVQLRWQSPVKGPVNPAFVPLWEPSGIGWLSGFDELLVRCGLENNGAPEFNPNGTLRYPLHGKIANTPARRVELSIDGDTGRITITGVVDETRLFGNKLRLISSISTQVGQPGLTINDTVVNLSAEPSELELLYHINFGPPLIRPGARVVLPIRKLAPRDAVAVGNVGEWNVYGPETPGLGEACFFVDLATRPDGSTQTMLRSADGSQGASLKFNKGQFPCFTLWKNRQAQADGYVTGMEPGINFPNTRSYEKKHGRVAVLQPGESRTYEVTLEGHPTPAAVAAAEKAIAAIQGSQKPEILSQPQAGWSV